MKKSAFTLAEILVSLGVIGVVAAMTIPTLMQNYQKDVYVTTLKKAYNDIDNAIQRKMTDMNADDLIQAGLTSQNAVNAFVEGYLKYNKKCTGTIVGCFDDLNNYSKLKNSTLSMVQSQSYILAGGISIKPVYRSENNPHLIVIIDVNGMKKPNILGRDLFSIAVYDNGIIDEYKNNTTAPISPEDRNSLFETQCNAENVNMWGCFGKILNDNWQMKY